MGIETASGETIFPVCATDSAHACGSALSTRECGAAEGVRGLVSPGHQSNSAELHVALQVVDAHQAHV